MSIPFFAINPANALLSVSRFNRRWVVGICLVLAGCATDPNGVHTAFNGSNASDEIGYTWQTRPDPIGEFIARKRTENIKINPEDVNNVLARQALTQLGIRYRFGGKSPETGFDCSGLVFYSAQESLGLKLPPRSDDMAKLGSNIERNQLQVGEVVFFNTMGRRFSHVGVYLGDSKFVHSPATGGVVRIEDLNERYWDKRFTGARRLEGAEFASAVPNTSLNDAAPITISTQGTYGSISAHKPTSAHLNSSQPRQTTLIKDKKPAARANASKLDDKSSSKVTAKSGSQSETKSASKSSAKSGNKTDAKPEPQSIASKSSTSTSQQTRDPKLATSTKPAQTTTNR